MEDEIDRLLRLGVITLTDAGKCPFGSTIVVVGKKDGSWRMCVDYRRLNQQTIKYRYQLRRINEIFTGLHAAQHFIMWDLQMDYHQVDIREKDRPKTSFATHRGFHYFNRMSFGLTNAPGTFQRLISQLLHAHIGVDTAVYLDDVLLYGATERELLRIFQRTLQHFIRANLRCKPRKCQLFPVTVPYLGHILGNGEIRPDSGEFEKIRDWPFPRNGTQVLAFLGLCGYYRRFIPEFANMAEPLYKIPQLAQVPETKELHKAFHELKDFLCNAVPLQLHNPVATFILETDASLNAVGAVLIQHDVPTGEERPVSFHSQTLNGPQRRYSTFEREMLAVVLACEAYRVFLLGNTFTLRADHRSLMGIFYSSLQSSNRVFKWVMRSQPYHSHVQIV